MKIKKHLLVHVEFGVERSQSLLSQFDAVLTNFDGLVGGTLGIIRGRVTDKYFIGVTQTARHHCFRTDWHHDINVK